jgi:hypothetical protein
MAIPTGEIILLFEPIIAAWILLLITVPYFSKKIAESRERKASEALDLLGEALMDADLKVTENYEGLKKHAHAFKDLDKYHAGPSKTAREARMRATLRADATKVAASLRYAQQTVETAEAALEYLDRDSLPYKQLMRREAKLLDHVGNIFTAMPQYASQFPTLAHRVEQLRKLGVEFKG